VRFYSFLPKKRQLSHIFCEFLPILTSGLGRPLFLMEMRVDGFSAGLLNPSQAGLSQDRKTLRRQIAKEATFSD